MKILVINPNNWYNKGDTSNRLGLVSALKKAFGNKLTISIETLTPEPDARFFSKYGVNVIESVFSSGNVSPEYRYLLGISSLIRKTRDALLLLFFLLVYRIFGLKPRLHHKAAIFLLELIDSDLVISSPGGFLQDYDVFSAWIPNIFLLICAKILRKPIIIYAQSLGPFNNKVLRFVSKLLLNRVDIIILREGVSKAYLDEAGITRPPIFITADASFSLNPPHYDKVLYRRKLLDTLQGSGESILIGVTVLGERYFLRQRKYSLLLKYIKALVFTINYIIRKLNARFIFVPQVAGNHELAIAHKVMRLIDKKNKKYISIINKDLPPDEVMKIIGCMDLFIGTRMHSNIFAAIMGVPFIAIAYQHKTHGIINMLNLREWMINLEDIDGHELAFKLEKLYFKRYEIKEKLVVIRENMMKKSMVSAKIVRTWCEKYLAKKG